MTPSGRVGAKAFRARSLRRGVAAVFVIVVAAVLIILGPRGKKPLPLPVIPEKTMPTQKIDERENVRYLEYRGGKQKIEFKADRGFIGSDDQYHLVGHVQIADFGRQGGRKILASCEEIIHDADRTRFKLVGHVSVSLDEATFTTDTLNYDRDKDEFSTDNAVAVTSPKAKGTARGLTYSLKTEEIWLRSEVRIETKASEKSPLPLVVLSPTLYYKRPARMGRLEGGVDFFHGQSRGSAQTVEFTVFPDTDKLNTIDFTGGVKVHLVKELKTSEQTGAAKPSEQPPSNSALSLGEDQDIQADEIKLRAYLNTSIIHSYESSGKAAITFRSSTRGETHFAANSIDFIFERDGSLIEFRAATDVRMKRVQAGGETQTAQGDTLDLPWKSNILQIKPTKGKKVTTDFRGSRIETDVLGIDVKNDDVQAATVKAVFQPSADKKPVGLFTSDKPVFITSRFMKFTAETKVYRFFGVAKMWQEKSELRAEDIQLTEATGETTCLGTVRSRFPHTPKDKTTEEIVEISGQRMHYDPDRNTAFYENETAVKTGTFSLTARSVTVLLSKESKEAQKVTAVTNVAIKQPNRDASGDEALYLVDDRLLILSGHPVVNEKDKGETRGDKLTFHLADDTITVENAKRNRSVTKIKS
jgi:LPS export ABC transporter protein LptC/lipopolysaccharide transport protein LptA